MFTEDNNSSCTAFEFGSPLPKSFCLPKSKYTNDDDSRRISPTKNTKLVSKASQPPFVSKNHSRSNSLHKKNTLRRTKSTFLSTTTNSNNVQTNNFFLNFKFDNLNIKQNNTLKFSLAKLQQQHQQQQQQQQQQQHNLQQLDSEDDDLDFHHSKPFNDDFKPFNDDNITLSNSEDDDNDDNDNHTSTILGAALGRSLDNDLDAFCVPTPLGKKINPGTFMNDYSDLDTPSKGELSSPLQRRPLRNKVRRFRSMYYDPNELNANSPISKASKSATTTPIEDDFMIEDSYLKKSKLETFYVKDDTIPRINANTLVQLLDGQHGSSFDKVVIVDCRFEYEYQGGHINGSLNINSQQQLEETFLTSCYSNGQFHSNKKTLMVFHCEFSSYRGPFMALHLRKCDRIINEENYPNLSYPNIVVLEGGYKSFFNLHAPRCYPQCYVEMNDDKHKVTCERELNRFRKDRKKILTKALSFHFGSSSFSGGQNSASNNSSAFLGNRNGASLITNTSRVTTTTLLDNNTNPSKLVHHKSASSFSFTYGGLLD